MDNAPTPHELDMSTRILCLDVLGVVCVALKRRSMGACHHRISEQASLLIRIVVLCACFTGVSMAIILLIFLVEPLYRCGSNIQKVIPESAWYRPN